MSVKTCKNCNAKYDKDLITCPYCGAEDAEAAYQKQREYVDGHKNRSKFWEKLPDTIVRLTDSAMKKTAFFAVGIFIVVLLIGFVGAKIYSSMGVWRMDREIAKLESYYQAGDYEGLQEYFWSLDSTYGGVYEKYDRTIHAYLHVTWAVRDLEELADKDYINYHTAENVEELLEETIATLQELKGLEEEGFPYEEGDAILEFKEQLETAVRTYLPLTEEEFKDACDRYAEDGHNDYSNEAGWIIKQLSGGNN